MGIVHEIIEDNREKLRLLSMVKQMNKGDDNSLAYFIPAIG